MKALQTVFCIGAALAGMQAAHAQVLAYGNATGSNSFDHNDPVPDDQYGATSYSPGTQLAVGFTTGNIGGFLHHVTLDLYSDTSSLAQPHVYLYTGATTPTSQVADLGVQTLSNTHPGATGIIFNGSSFQLQSGQTYWIVVENDNASVNLAWSKSDAVDGTAASGSNNWQYNPANGGIDSSQIGGAGTSETPNFAVYTTASVPEPHEYALIAGLGLCAFGVYRRRSLMAKA